MKKLNVIILTIIFLIGISLPASAETTMLEPDDYTGMTLWVVSMACLATTVFIFVERSSIALPWRPALTVAGIITGITFVNYLYIRGIWVNTNDLPIIYRYMEWLITMPLSMITFYFLIAAVRKVSSVIFWKLSIGTIIMVYGGYAGESGDLPAFFGFIIWMVGWIFILYEVHSGDAGRLVERSSNRSLTSAFGTMRMIVTIGWAVYPLGYVFGPALTATIDSDTLNIIYNFADLINKIAFALVVWNVAIANTSGSRR